MENGNKLLHQAVEGLRGYINKRFGGNVAAARRAFGMKSATLDTWLNGTRRPSLAKLGPILETLGARIIFPGEAETARDVCFVNARIVPVGENQPPPEVADYMAVPVVEEVGAGPGLIPQGEILSWFLVYKHQDAVRYKRNLVAVQIGKKSTSMEPTLHPRDIVLVDLDDKDVNKPGHIMLVMDEEGSGMIKRVKVEEIMGGKDWRIIYYSDNVADNPPILYSLKNDFLGEWERAIAGRVVWAWSDVSGK